MKCVVKNVCLKRKLVSVYILFIGDQKKMVHVESGGQIKFLIEFIGVMSYIISPDYLKYFNEDFK